MLSQVTYVINLLINAQSQMVTWHKVVETEQSKWWTFSNASLQGHDCWHPLFLVHQIPLSHRTQIQHITHRAFLGESNNIFGFIGSRVVGIFAEFTAAQFDKNTWRQLPLGKRHEQHNLHSHETSYASNFYGLWKSPKILLSFYFIPSVAKYLKQCRNFKFPGSKDLKWTLIAKADPTIFRASQHLEVFVFVLKKATSDHEQVRKHRDVRPNDGFLRQLVEFDTRWPFH